jgi:hypothetical protein
VPEFLTPYLGYIVTAAVVIVALILILMVIQTFGGRIRGRSGSRLGVSEYYEIDNERRLILVRRDDREHLILVGGNQDLVVETGIEVETESEHQERLRRSAYRRETSNRDDEDNRPIPLRAAPRPAVFGDRAPSLRPVGRDEPKLGAVSTSDEIDK